MTGKPTFDQLMTAKIAALEQLVVYTVAQQALMGKANAKTVRQWADDYMRPFDRHLPDDPSALLVSEALRELLDRVVATMERAEGK